MYTRFFKLQRVSQNFGRRKNTFSTNEEQVRFFLRKTIRVLDRDLAALEEKFPCLYSHSVEDTYLPVYHFLRNTVNIRDRGMTITFKTCPSVFLADVQEQLRVTGRVQDVPLVCGECGRAPCGRGSRATR